MLRIVELVIAAVIAALFFLVVGLFLPSKARIQRTVELGNPTTQVYDMLNGFHRFQDWNPWSGDHALRLTKSGERYGEGATLEYASDSYGSGKLTLRATEFEDEPKINFELENDWRGTNKSMEFRLIPDAKTRAVNLVWTTRVDYGFDIPGRYAGMYLDGRIGEQMETALARFAAVMASIPYVDYSQTNIEETSMLGFDILYVGGGIPSAPRKWDEAEALMDQSWKQVETFMQANKIEPTGARLRVINVIGEETNDYTMAYPVAAVSVPVTGNVRMGRSYEGLVLKTQYIGNRVAINVPRGPREALKAYAATHGYDYAWDGAGQFDYWLGDDDITGYPITDVYLPVVLKP